MDLQWADIFNVSPGMLNRVQVRVLLRQLSVPRKPQIWNPVSGLRTWVLLCPISFIYHRWTPVKMARDTSVQNQKPINQFGDHCCTFSRKPWSDQWLGEVPEQRWRTHNVAHAALSSLRSIKTRPLGRTHLTLRSLNKSIQWNHPGRTDRRSPTMTTFLNHPCRSRHVPLQGILKPHIENHGDWRDFFWGIPQSV